MKQAMYKLEQLFERAPSASAYARGHLDRLFRLMQVLDKVLIGEIIREVDQMREYRGLILGGQRGERFHRLSLGQWRVARSCTTRQGRLTIARQDHHFVHGIVER